MSQSHLMGNYPLLQHISAEERSRRRKIVNRNNYVKNRDKILNSRLKTSEIRSLQVQVSEVQLLHKREKQLLSYITESGLIPPPPVIEIDPNMISSNYQEEIATGTSSEISNSSNAINNELSNYQYEFMFLREEITINNGLICPSYVPNMIVENVLNINSSDEIGINNFLPHTNENYDDP
ncbi:7456_t:CDS:2, partial [Gigaspora margarita]